VVNIYAGEEEFKMLCFYARRALVMGLSLALAISMIVCYQAIQARADTIDDLNDTLREVNSQISPQNIGGECWINNFFRQFGQVQGEVSTEINTNGDIEQKRQELQLLAPGVFGAEASLDKEINGIQIHASSSSKVITSP
jgi:hypothetical protein